MCRYRTNASRPLTGASGVVLYPECRPSQDLVVSHAHDVEATERLERLVEAGVVDDILGVVSLNDIADAWNCYHRRDGGTYDPDWWAIEFWLYRNAAWKDETVLRAGLLALLDRVDEDFVGYVGAGPLEDFIEADESRLAWIEEQAANSERFRRALRVMHVWGVHRNDVAARIERAAGGALPRPRLWPRA
jgi:hypothetical protein